MINLNSVPNPVALPPLIKVHQVASLLSLSRQSVHNLIDSGQLTACPLNSKTAARIHVRITRISLLTFYKKRFGHSLERALAHAYEP